MTGELIGRVPPQPRCHLLGRSSTRAIRSALELSHQPGELFEVRRGGGGHGRSATRKLSVRVRRVGGALSAERVFTTCTLTDRVAGWPSVTRVWPCPGRSFGNVTI